jgi:hypothetical protein
MTRTMNTYPPIANDTLDELSGVGVLVVDAEARELMSTMGGLSGQFCYLCMLLGSELRLPCGAVFPRATFEDGPSDPA